MKKFFYLFAIAFIACEAKHSTRHFFELIAVNDIALKEPNKDDWRYTHLEKNQTFEAYKKEKPVCPTKEKNTIFIKPFGNFTPDQNKILQYTVDY